MAMIENIYETMNLRITETAFELHLRKIYPTRNILSMRETETVTESDIKWDKHMKDAIFLRTKGAIFNKEVYDKLTKLWIRKHGNKKVKMNVKNEDFFKENIKRKFNHEFLHEQFAFYDRPLNEKIRKDLNSPLCSEDLWNVLSEEDKIKCAFEELMVLTAERYIFVEGKDKLPIRFAKIKMLKNMITSTTSGWFNLFLKINFDELIKTDFPEYFYEKINELKDK